MASLNYNHLRYFWAVACEGNLTRAATQLHVSQSAVSVQIQKLEEELGHRLFERRGRQLVLTEAGRLAMEHAEVIFRTGRELEQTLRGGEGEERKVLRVGSLSTLSRNFQIRFLQPLLGREDVEIVVRSGTIRALLPELEALRLDVLLTNYSPPRDAQTVWAAHRLDDQPVSLVGHPRRLAARRDWRELLAAEPLVVPTVETSIRIGFDALVERHELRPRFAAEVDDMALLRLLARQDLGLAVVPPIVVRDELASGELVEAAALPGLAESFFAITPQRRFPNPLLKGLVVPQS